MNENNINSNLLENLSSNFLNQSNFFVANIEVLPFIIDLIIAAILSFVLVYIYRKFGKSLSNREQFSNNFVIITTTTMLIITIVKSSLALSLGLVGALSIVRFRAAIKEPEEIAYLFLCIAIGLGLGAQQSIITIIGFIIISLIIIIFSYKNIVNSSSPNLYLSFKNNSKKFTISEISNILKKYCNSIKLIRLDEDKNINEFLFLINFIDIENLDLCRDELNKLDDVEISFLEKQD